MSTNPTPPRKLTRGEWNKTPYAGSEAKDADGAIQRLLAKYKVKEVMTVSYTGPNGRPAYGIRFVLTGKSYRIALETLDVYPSHVAEQDLKTQVKRAIYFFLKSSLEMANVFMPPEQVLFAFLESPNAGGVTMYEAAQPYLQQLTAPDFGRLMLPPPREGGAA